MFDSAFETELCIVEISPIKPETSLVKPDNELCIVEISVVKPEISFVNPVISS
jgi:hypothetical protein